MLGLSLGVGGGMGGGGELNFPWGHGPKVAFHHDSQIKIFLDGALVGTRSLKP